MSTQITNAQIVQYEAEFQSALQQMGSVLRGTVFTRSGVIGGSVKFPVVGTAASIKNRARHSLLTSPNTAHSSATATLNNYESAEFLDSLDEFITNVDVRSAYMKGIAAVLGRDLDDVIIDAMSASHSSSSPSAASLDKSLIASMRALAGNKNWPANNNDWYWAVTPDVYSQFIKTGDFITNLNGNFNGLETGSTLKVGGFNIIECPELISYAVDSDTHKTYAFNKSSVGLAIAEDVKVKINYSAAHNSDIVLGEMRAGAVTIQADGVFEVQVNF